MTFEIKQLNPGEYRRQTRRSSLIIVSIFLLLAMLLSTGSVMLFGTPEGDNFRWNLGGVLSALLVTVALVRGQFWQRPWMAAAVYGWQLKRRLMSLTNVMHHVKTGVATQDQAAMKLLRFYHLGLTQMHQLDGNSGELIQLIAEINQHKEAMQAAGIDTEVQQLDPTWFDALKPYKTAQ